VGTVKTKTRQKVLREWNPFSEKSAVSSEKSMAMAVPNALSRLGLEHRWRETELRNAWPSIVGAEIARHAQPQSLKNRRLNVSVDHPLWLQELSRYHKPMILQKIAARFGPHIVRDIVFRIG
jgi:predicted nucleic acid-binding Zn ribbon protein